MKVSIIGLGKLGLPMAAYFADNGHEVVGLDVNAKHVERLKAGECPIEETGLSDLLKQQTLEFTTDFNDVMDTEIMFMIVPTPSNGDGRFSNEYVLSAVERLHKYTGLVVITSTVMPGSCMNEFRPLLPNSALCYNPEFVALGSVLRNMKGPDAILIGEDTEESGNKLESFYHTIHQGRIPICRMSLWNAEIAKLALNVCVTTKIGLANTIAAVCERVPSGNVDAVTRFIGLDSRIGSKYFGGGLGFGGPCFPRDGRAFVQMASDLDVDCIVQLANDKFNVSYTRSVVIRALQLLGSNNTISILGLTYKTATSVVEESAAVQIAEMLAHEGLKVKVYDPQGMDNAQKVLENRVKYCICAADCLVGSSLAIIATPWDEFKALKSEAFIARMDNPVVLDCWRVLELDSSGVEYHAIGVGK